MEGLALGGAFESHVLPEVGQPLLVLVFIAAADIEHEATVGDLGRGDLLVEYPDAVGQGMEVIIRHQCHGLGCKDKQKMRL